MAKGRSAKEKDPSDDMMKDSSMKVSSSDAEPALVTGGGDEEREEIWDVVHVIGKDETICCRTEDCEEAAVATWATNLDPDTKWSVCEPCQFKDFGGWPEGFDPSAKANADVAPSANETLEVATNKEVLPKDLTGDTTMDIDDKASTTKRQEAPKEEAEEIQGSSNAEAAPTDANANDRETDDSSITNKSDTMVDMQVNVDVAENATSSVSDDAKETQTDSSDRVDENNDDEEEKWDLMKVLSHSQVTKECPIKCSTDDCRLVACCVWISNLSSDKWYSCIDCQENDFGGWPPADELPVQTLATDHIHALVAKCSKQKSPVMPALAESLSPKKQNNNGLATNLVTPPSNSVHSGNGQQATSKGCKSTITPTPSRSTQASAAALKRHREWQVAAEKAGGPDARIVVKKADVKPLIFDVLYDAFRPMNITHIYNELKAVVPSTVLKSCLDEMALDRNENPFDESDDEDNKPKAAKKTESSGDPHAGTLAFKAGRNANTCLYYVDHTKQKNNGDGLEPDQRNALSGDFAKAQADESGLKASLQRMIAETMQLLSEPTNEEASATLEVQEAAMNTLRDQLDAARKLKVNEKHKKQTKKRIDGMVAQWRKRKRLCMDFLITMEESTEGTVSAKKCLSGDGQLDIESDETAISGALAYGKRKRSGSGPPTKKMKVTKGLTGSNSKAQEPKSLAGGLKADVMFVAVKLDAMGSVCRVYLDADE